jgi:hypothetical protein
MKMVSPNEMMQASKDHMLEGREPQSPRDWQCLVNFWAFNAEEDCEVGVATIMALCFDCPLEDIEISKIAKMQANTKKRG